MSRLSFVVIVTLICAVSSKPVDKSDGIAETTHTEVHNVERRFIHPDLTSGDFDDGGLNKMRTKRSEEDCERLRLCRLHARANRSFFAAFELYFVNRENARLWDHRAHTLADCAQRFSCYDR